MINSPYAKAIVAAIITAATAGLVAVQTLIPLSTTGHGWVTVILTVLGSIAGTIGVYQTPNTPVPAPTKE